MATIKTKKDYYKPTKYFEPTQPNPTEKIGNGKKADCTIRAFAIVENISWVEAYDILSENARKIYTVPNDDINIYDVLRNRGYLEHTEKAERGVKRLTVENFAKANPVGRYILKCANHITAVVDGKIRDSWNTSNVCVYRYFEKK